MGQTAGFAAGSWIARQAAHTTCSGSHLDIIVTHAGLQSLRFTGLRNNCFNAARCQNTQNRLLADFAGRTGCVHQK